LELTASQEATKTLQKQREATCSVTI
jgi:hypothetical protein